MQDGAALRAELDALGREDVIIAPPMPESLSRLSAWICRLQDLHSEGRLTAEVLRECRRSAGAVGDVHRAMADVKKADAAMESAVAQTRMAEVLAAFEHGGPAVAMLARLQEGLGEGKRRPLPGRAVKSIVEGKPA